MRLVQKKGPFSKNASFRVGGGSLNSYVHVGIQVPKTQPLAANSSDIIPFINDRPQDTYSSKAIYRENLSPDISIQTNEGVSNFYINRSGILEFDTNVGTTVTIMFLKDMPPETIVDLVYNEK